MDREKFTHLLCFKELNSQLLQDKKKRCTGIALCTVKQLLHTVCLQVISLTKLRRKSDTFEAARKAAVKNPH